ncbi:hypothetical protein [Bradyrhizobium sp. SBR1B]|uniref:hypothetical protein n=1 Tax=Bradyrhizobium sp. SBR1B TaxID=2663836 RepID=UPI001605F039|nr:hypothetical protein [Bradyrhizobium sp. SBR1B]MBB4375620.1 hypothetical protein [Bradyrhizobium sp. SBR1B]
MSEKPIGLFALAGAFVWLFVALPLIYLPEGWAAFFKWLHNWQTLVAAGVALLAAMLAFHNTTRSLTHSEQLDFRRRARKHAAIRAMLPLALAEITRYTHESVAELKKLLEKCDEETLPKGAACEEFVRSLPTESLSTLSEFIEYSEEADVNLMEAILARVQIHDSRTRSLVTANSPYSGGVVIRTELENLIIDAAIINAGTTSFFNYARRHVDRSPKELSWDMVDSALMRLDVWEDSFPRVYEAAERRRGLGGSPIDFASWQRRSRGPSLGA